MTIEEIIMAIDKIHDFFIIHITEHLSKMNNFPNVIQGMGLALLTILIPLAIAVLADIYQKRKNKEKEFVDLDLHVILDNVFNIRLLIFSVFLMFIPMLFWDILIGLYKLIPIILNTVGIILVTVIIIKVYHWIKGNIFDFRLSYLKKVKKYDDLGIVWKSIWEVKKINFQDEIEFCKIFFSKIDHLQELPKSNLKIISKLLNDFYNSINERSISVLQTDMAFTRILEWHFKTWKNNYIFIKKYLDNKNENKIKSFLNYSEILRMLDSILDNIEERSLKVQQVFYSFIIHFKKHAEKYKDELVENGNKHFYISYLFELFYRVFFKNIEKLDFSVKHFIWDQCFPKEWKISKTNLADEKNKLFSNLSLRCFINWALQRISQAKEEKDFVLGEVLSNLFPEVEPNLWAKFLIFVFSVSIPKDRVKLAIEKPWNFGFISRIKMYPVEIGNGEMHKKKFEEDSKKERQKTYELACYLFKKEFSKENIEVYMKEIENLKYTIELPEENRRLELLNIFKEMLSYISKINKC
ncbi:MAG TPA: hypothetical protein VMZ91_10105 [Candidatus Paceibacterota bacterium]|nr:hypothetical protein [Candidatus Paceibacterota bacterium]